MVVLDAQDSMISSTFGRVAADRMPTCPSAR
jgi:hypothetical protein